MMMIMQRGAHLPRSCRHICVGYAVLEEWVQPVTHPCSASLSFPTWRFALTFARSYRR